MKKQLRNKLMMVGLALSITALGAGLGNGFIPKTVEAKDISEGITSSANGHYIEVEKGVKLYVEDVGKGKPVVFVHGWPVNHQMFEYQEDILPSKGVRFIGIDLRGFGQSDHPLNGYDFDTMAKDIHTVIEKLNLKDVTLVGWSMGGAISAHYAAKYKDNTVSKLVIADAPIPIWTKTTEFPNNGTKDALNGLIDSLYVDRPKAISDISKNVFYKERSPEFMQWFVQLNLDNDPHATIESFKSVRDGDLRAELPQIKIPTLILHGVHDNVVPYYLAEATNKLIKNSKLVPFENSGHGLNFDEQDKFNSEIIKFVQP